MSLIQTLRRGYNKNVRTSLLSLVALALIVVVCFHYKDYRSGHFSEFVKGFLVDWPVGALSLTISLVTFFGVDVVRDKSERIEEALQSRLTSFSDIQREAFELLQWVTVVPEKTKFWMTAATPVFGLEAEQATVDEWTKLFKTRLAVKAETKLLCYQWFSPRGIENSALARFAKALSIARGGEPPQWWAACVKAWKEFDKLQRQILTPKDNFEVKLIDEPNFGIIFAELSPKESSAIIYLSNSATPKKGAMGFRTKDPNWLDLIKETFNSLSKSADIPPEPQHRQLLERDEELYETFLQQYEKRRPTELSLSQYVQTAAGNRIEVKVFPGVFPVENSLDTLHMVKAIDWIIPLIRKHSLNLRYSIKHILGVDVGTGTGALGLAMAGHTDDLIATDNYEPACKNALFNFRKAAYEYRDCKDGLKGLRLLYNEILELSEDLLQQQLMEKNYHDDGKYDEDGEAKRTFKPSRHVINCDLAKQVYRRTDDELMVFAFNYPAYQSPSNVFNTGGKNAGGKVVENFLVDLRHRLRCTDVILLPELHFSGASFITIPDIAHFNGYCCLEIYNDYVEAKKVTVRVYALCKVASDDRKSWAYQKSPESHEFLTKIQAEVTAKGAARRLIHGN